MMEFDVDMKQFEENWCWHTDSVHYGDLIAKMNGKFVTYNGSTYMRLLNDFNIAFTFKTE